MEDDILKSLEEEANELEDLLKSGDEEYDDDDFEDDEDDEEEEDDDDDEEDMEKSLEIYEDENEEDVYVDAAPILEKSVKVQEAAMTISEENRELLKSLSKTVLTLAKAMGQFLREPQGELAGSLPPGQKTMKKVLQKSKEDKKSGYHGFTFKQAKSLLLKSFQDGQLERNAITYFEQGGVVTPEANNVLLKAKGGNE